MGRNIKNIATILLCIVMILTNTITAQASNSDDHGAYETQSPPIPYKVGTINMNKGETIIIPISDLVKYGERVVKAGYGNAEILKVKALGVDGLRITAIGLGATYVNAVIENEYGSIRIKFNVQVLDEASTDLHKIAEIMDSLALLVENPVGKNNIPTIDLPVTDNLGYGSTIGWLAEDDILDDDLITISDGKAIISRRGTKGGGGCEGHEESIAAFSSDIIELFCSDCEDEGGCGGDTGSDAGPGGRKNIAHLIAIINLGEVQDSKEFKITIPWGWGKEITIGENLGKDDKPGSGGCDDGGCEEEELIPYNDLEYELWVNQFPLILGASELAAAGKKVTEFEIIDEQPLENEDSANHHRIKPIKIDEEEATKIVECKIANDGRLWISPIGAGEATIRAIVSNEKSSEGCDKTVINTLSCGGTTEDEYDEVETEIHISTIKPNLKGLNAEELVDGAKNCLDLMVVTSGHGAKQTNKINLPYTDYLGYETEITWETDDSQFISIEGNRAIIHRRGSNHGGGGCGSESGGCEDNSETICMLSSAEVGILCSDGGCSDGCSDGGCSDGGGSQGGRINTAHLTAIIEKDDASDVKVFEVIIPWGWGRKIVIE